MDECNDINSCRTRTSIATSCISTIFLCTWVAFHPNIPGLEEPKRKVITRRIGCMIGGVLAPEIYVLLAARQFIAARAFAKTYRRLGWTLTHGFFALMGGFMIYNGERAIEISLYDPNWECYPLDDDFGRTIMSLSAFERRLAAQFRESSDSSSPTPCVRYLKHCITALRYIESHPAAFETTIRRVEQGLGRSIGQCVQELVEFNRASIDDGLIIKRIRLSYENNQWGRRWVEGILTLLEIFEHYTVNAALEINENTVHVNMTETADGTEESVSGRGFNPSIEDSRLRDLVPRINEQDIRDKSKSDILTKTIALFQVAWFVLQLGARYHQKLAITGLEIVTLAFCVLNFATYVLWWKKPFAVDRGYAMRRRDNDDGWEVFIPRAPPFVETPEVPWYQRFRNWMNDIREGVGQTLIFCAFETAPGAHYQAAEEGQGSHEGRSSLISYSAADTTLSPSYRPSQLFMSLWQKLRPALSMLLERVAISIANAITVVFERIPTGETKLLDSGKRVSTFSPTMMKLGGYDATIYYLSGCFLIFVFGSIHFLAWSSGPTNADKLIWRICSISVIVLPMIVFLLEKYSNFLRKLENDIVKAIAVITGLSSLTAPLFYILARIGLLVLVVRSLVYCPSSALQVVSWSQLIPHL